MATRPEDLAAALVERARCRRERAERAADIARRAVIERLKDVVRSGTCGRAWLVGSLVWGPVHERSDVDVVVEGLAPEREAELWNQLSDVSGKHVDLLRLEELDESFRHRVLREGMGVDVA